MQHQEPNAHQRKEEVIVLYEANLNLSLKRTIAKMGMEKKRGLNSKYNSPPRYKGQGTNHISRGERGRYLGAEGLLFPPGRTLKGTSKIRETTPCTWFSRVYKIIPFE